MTNDEWREKPEIRTTKALGWLLGSLLISRFGFLSFPPCGIIRHLSFSPNDPHSPAKDFAPLPNGHGNHPRPARSFPGNPARRICRHYGAVRVGQINVDEPNRLPRYADFRRLRIERRAGQPNG